MVTPEEARELAQNEYYQAPLACRTIIDLARQVEALQADAARLDWMQGTMTGASDSERYLPFRVYWGQTKNIRAAIDEARKQP